jgi:hypothetical protein
MDYLVGPLLLCLPAAEVASSLDETESKDKAQARRHEETPRDPVGQKARSPCGFHVETAS